MICPACHSANPDDSRFCLRCATPLPVLNETMLADSPRLDYAQLLQPGSLFADRYRLVGELGRGGMGVVFKAEDVKLRRFVALKILPPELSAHPEAMQRFAQEARAASMLDHINICTIFEIGETPLGQKYISMAYCEGESLFQRLNRGPLPLARALEVIRQVAQGLAAAHKIGIVHRDIKPANIMISREGVVKLVDFGLAKLIGQSQLTKTSAVLGTTFYMSPEQTQGGVVDARSDLWSLGVVFYEILTGRQPFPGDYVQAVIYAIINRTPLPIRETHKEIPLEVEHLIFKCLSKKPDDRFVSAKSLLLELDRLGQAPESGRAGAEGIAAEKRDSRREAERRQATVVSIAVEGFSEIFEKDGGEEGALTLHRCFQFIESELKKYGAHIERVAPGNILALFGVPRALEDAPQRAINAAIGLRKSFDPFVQKEFPRCPARLRIGISTGLVIAGGLGATGKEEGPVMGEAVTHSSALKDLAPPHKIYVGSSTYRLTKDEFVFRALEPLHPKDTKQPLSAFEMLSQEEHVQRPRRGSERTIHSELVGREKELSKLKLQVLKAVTGQGSIVNIIGEAGIGKSRLVTELCRIEEMKTVTLLVGRGLSGGQNLSFHPLIEILRSWAGISNDDDLESSARKLERAVRNVDPDGLAEIYPFIAKILGLNLSGKYAERVKGIQGEALERLILRTLRELLIKAAQIRPVVIIVEDLHWADPSSIELLESLFRLADQNRILFLNIFRPNHPETSDRILRTVRNRYANFHFEIHLGPLSDTACGILINNLLKSGLIHGPVRDLIAKRAEGNPFFIEEIARSLIDDGSVIIENGLFKATEKIHNLVIPETLADVIMARVDKLDEDSKTLLKLASVIGKEFLFGVLKEVGRSVDRLEERLDSLRDVQLIGTRPSGSEVEYHFKHALVRDAVYESMLQGTRKKIHLEVAQTIERIYGARLPEFAGTLALHFSQGGDEEKAEEYLIKAGEEALKIAASSVAINHYREALDLYLRKQGPAADPRKAALLEKNIALANFNKGHMVEAVEHFDRVLELEGRPRSTSKVRQILHLASNLISMLYRLYFSSRRGRKAPSDKDREMLYLAEKKGLALTSVDHFKMFMDMIESSRKLQTIDIAKMEDGVSLYSAASALFSYTGISFNISRRILEVARKALAPGDIKSFFAYSFYQLTHDYPSGNWEKDRIYDLDLVDANIKLGEVFRAAGYSLWSGLIAAEEGKFDEAQLCADKLFEVRDVFEHDYARSRGYLVQCTLLWKRGRLEECSRKTEEALSFMKKAGENLAALRVLGIKAQIQLLHGDLSGAESTLSLAQDFISHEKRIVPFFLSSFFKCLFLCDMIRAEASSKKPDSPAKQDWKRAGKSGRMALRNAKKFAPAKTEITRLQGTCAWFQGEKDKARKWWDQSIQIGRELGARPELARTYLEAGRRLVAEDTRGRETKESQGDEYLRQAKCLFEEMGMTEEFEAMEDIGRSPVL